MADLCEKMSNGAQNVGDGRRFASFPVPTRIFTVCHRNESFNPCKKIASIVAHNDCVWSDRYSCSICLGGKLNETKNGIFWKNTWKMNEKWIKVYDLGHTTHFITGTFFQLILNLFGIVRQRIDQWLLNLMFTTIEFRFHYVAEKWIHFDITAYSLQLHEFIATHIWFEKLLVRWCKNCSVYLAILPIDFVTVDSKIAQKLCKIDVAFVFVTLSCELCKSIEWHSMNWIRCQIINNENKMFWFFLCQIACFWQFCQTHTKHQNNDKLNISFDIRSIKYINSYSINDIYVAMPKTIWISYFHWTRC